jgi:uncharacterized repeat protein (TIGR01451 family)
MPALLNRLCWRVCRGLLIVSLLYGLAEPGLLAPEQVEAQAPQAQAPEAQTPAEPADTKPPQDFYGPLVVQSSRWDTSPTLRSIVPKAAPSFRKFGSPPEIPNPVLPKTINTKENTQKILSPAQLDTGNLSQAANLMPDPLWSFDGVTNLFGGWPPDTQGDIGPNHYVQWINLHFAIWQLDKKNHTATLVYGPVPGTTLFSGFGGPCEFNNDGDPVTLYDPFADRWFMSQFALPNYPNGPFYQCIAVSATPDPTGSWYRYEFQMPVNKMNDYTKFGVWPNAYYMTVNLFNAGSLSWGGTGVAALDRQAMLNGAPARMVFFDLYGVNPNFGGILPADFDGTNQPLANSLGYFAEWDDSSWIGPVDALRVWEFHVDWSNPDAATFGLGGNPNRVIPTQYVDPNMCSMSRNCIPQPGTTNKVDAISDRLMHRLQYRNFGGYETLVSNHTVDVDGTDHAGIHWFELRKEALGPDWALYQQGVYAPDSNNRWMGSMAMDHVGDIALGYSVSSSTVYPSVRYTGRLAGDPLGTLPQGEKSIVEGTGSQTSSNRWGDYSMMGVDPVDDCTFWYTQEYVATSGYNTWKTRIGAFKFPGCSIGPQGTLKGTVTSEGGPAIEAAQVRATLSPTQTIGTLTKADGGYLLAAPVGVYTVTASAYGYFPEVASGVEVLSGTETVQNFELEVAPTHVISGVVSDADTGWSLYAKITPTGTPLTPVWSDPITGFYSMTLPEGTSYTFNVEAFAAGYLPQTVAVGTISGDMTKNIQLEVDAATCDAQGYKPLITPVYSSTFESNNGGLTTSGTTSWAWGVITSGPGSAHSGTKTWATNPGGDYQNSENGAVNLALDMSGYPGQNLGITWWQWLKTENRYDYATLEASNDGGVSWKPVYGPVTGDVDLAWSQHFVTLDPSYAVANLRLRFNFTSDGSVTYPGWYLDDLVVGPGSCQAQPGSLLMGNVFDANTSDGLVDALVTSDSGSVATTQATPEDPHQADGFYTLFALQGTHTFTATFGTEYAADVESRAVPLHQAVRQDFQLQAGRILYTPDAVQATLDMGATLTQPLTLTNQGGLPANYELVEIAGGFVPRGPVEKPNFVLKPFKQDVLTSEGLGVPDAPQYPPLSAGQVINHWLPAGATGAYAVAYNGLSHSVWVSSPSPLWYGNDRLYEYTPAGAATGRSWPQTAAHSFGPADLAYNWNTGNLWIMNVNTGIANCIYEIAPDHGYTGASICPGGGSGFDISQRGLAYDPDTDTWFAGSWNDLMIHRFDNSGTILSSVNVGLAISGLAYNPDTHHLFVMTSSAATAVVVLDVANNYAVLGQFSISQGFGAYSGAGMEIDCDGNLWALDLNTNTVYQFNSGETATLCHRDVPWISTLPVSGTLGIGADQLVQVRFDAGVPAIDQPGAYSMQLKVKENTPYSVPNVPVTMTVNAPATWGKLDGVVSSPGYCDTNPQPLANAAVLITASSGLTWTVQTNAAGFYQRWLDQAGSPFTVTLNLADYQSASANGITVSGGLTTTANLDLFWLKPCVQVDPHSIDLTVKTGRVITSSLTLENNGHADTPYNWHESAGGVTGPAGPFVNLDWLAVAPVSGTLMALSGPQAALVTLDANGTSVTTPGVYTGTLNLESNDPMHAWQAVPVTLTVLRREYGVVVSGDMSGQDIPGEVLTYTMSLTNTSEGLVDSFNINLGSHAWQTTAIPATIGPLASGATAQVKLRVQVPVSALPGEADAVVVNAASQGDPTKTAALTITTTAQTPSADLVIAKSAFPDPVWVGQILTYTITLTNTGPTKASNATLVDVLPTRVDYLSSDGNCSLTSHVLVCDLGTLGVGESRTVRIRVRAMGSDVLVNQAVITSEATDPNLENNWATVQTLALGYIYYFPVIGR